VHSVLSYQRPTSQYLLCLHKRQFQFLFCVTLLKHISSKKDSQNLQPNQKYSHKINLQSSHPFLDQKGVPKVGGRLQELSLPYLNIQQLILPDNIYCTARRLGCGHLNSHGTKAPTHLNAQYTHIIIAPLVIFTFYNSCSSHFTQLCTDALYEWPLIFETLYVCCFSMQRTVSFLSNDLFNSMM
jgi:hypothetical protein